MTNQSLFLLAPICGIPRRRFPLVPQLGGFHAHPHVLLGISSVTTVSHIISSCYPSWQLDRTPHLPHIYICIYSYCWSPSPCLFLGWFIPIVQKIIKIQVINYCWFLPRDVSYIRASSLLWLLLDFHVFLKQWNPIVLSPQVCLPFPSY